MDVGLVCVVVKVLVGAAVVLVVFEVSSVVATKVTGGFVPAVVCAAVAKVDVNAFSVKFKNKNLAVQLTFKSGFLCCYRWCRVCKIYFCGLRLSSAVRHQS